MRSSNPPPFVADLSPLSIKHAMRITLACPTQWEALTEEGRHVYIRYRWGELTISIGRPGGTKMDAVGGERWFWGEVGERLGGVIELDEVCEATGLVVLSERADSVCWPTREEVAKRLDE